MTVTAPTVDVIHGDCADVLDTLAPDAIVTDPPERIQAKPGKIERLRERAGGHLGYIGRADTMLSDITRFVVPPERVVVWAPPNALAKHYRKSVGWVWYPIYLWGIHDDHDGYHDDLWSIPLHPRTDHPGEKPPRVMEGIIRLISRPGDLVVDPYCGSGATLTAAAHCGRRAVGIETDPKWASLAKERTA